MKRIIIILVVVISMILFNLPKTVEAFSSDEHNDYLEEVLFGTYESIERTDNRVKVISALESASYLAIDYIDEAKEKDALKKLKDFGVAWLPYKIEKITLKGINKGQHRKYTHLGWDYKYEQDKANWSKRKLILLSTVNKAFDFGMLSGRIFGYHEKCIAFSKLIYYVHLLGDSIYNYEKDNLDDQTTLSVGDFNDTGDGVFILPEIKQLCKDLFADQEGNRKYNTLFHELNSIEDRVDEIKRLEEKPTFIGETYKKIAIDLMKCLVDNIPYLLQGESFFYDVFYK